jgi:hypothetical protein
MHNLSRKYSIFLWNNNSKMLSPICSLLDFLRQHPRPTFKGSATHLWVTTHRLGITGLSDLSKCTRISLPTICQNNSSSGNQQCDPQEKLYANVKFTICLLVRRCFSWRFKLKIIVLFGVRVAKYSASWHSVHRYVSGIKIVFVHNGKKCGRCSAAGKFIHVSGLIFWLAEAWDRVPYRSSVKLT